MPEMVQRRAARCVCNNCVGVSQTCYNPYTGLVWNYVRRKFLKLILLFKILHEQIRIPTKNFQQQAFVL